MLIHLRDLAHFNWSGFSKCFETDRGQLLQKSISFQKLNVLQPCCSESFEDKCEANVVEEMCEADNVGKVVQYNDNNASKMCQCLVLRCII